MRTPELHRCEECGGIAEWHYYLKYGSKGELGIALGLSDGQKGFAPGQGAIGNEMRTIRCDLTRPVTLPTFPAA